MRGTSPSSPFQNRVPTWIAIAFQRIGAGVWMGVIAAALAGAMNSARATIYPENSGVIDVTKPPYLAKGDGVADDTEAIQQALLEHGNTNRIIYLPKGTYRISGSLRWPGGSAVSSRYRATILQGQGLGLTRLQLMDYAPGFQNAGRPKAVLWTGERGSRRDRNAIRGLTLDTGKHNPGAIGIQFFAQQQGGIEDVEIRCGDHSGIAGIDATHSDEPGPFLLKRVVIRGFEFGIRTSFSVNGFCAEDLTLVGQTEAGIRNSGQSLTLRRLISTNRCPAILNADSTGFVCLMDSQLAGIAEQRIPPGIDNRGFLYARNVQITGYQPHISSRSFGATGSARSDVSSDGEFVSHQPWNLFPGPSRSLGLPVLETPESPMDPPEQWVNPITYGGHPNDGEDDSAAFQRAIDSGATTLGVPNGVWVLRRPVIVRKSLRRIVGCEARIRLDPQNTEAGFIVQGEVAPTVFFEQLQGEGSAPLLDVRSKHTVVVRHCSDLRTSWNGSGDVFLEDVHSSGPMHFKRQRVWARQLTLDPEGAKVVNEGGQVWILGLSTGRPGTAVVTRNGGRTEILGGLALSTGGWKGDPLFVVDASAASFVFSEASFLGTPYQTIVSETRGGENRRLMNRGNIGTGSGRELPFHSGGVALPLFTAYEQAPEPLSPSKP